MRKDFQMPVGLKRAFAANSSLVFLKSGSEFAQMVGTLVPAKQSVLWCMIVMFSIATSDGGHCCM
jgi:hypothetical protein